MTTYDVDGMTCGGCVRGLEAALKRAAPHVSARVEIGRVTVQGEHDPEVVKRAIEDAGFDLKH